MNKKGFTLIELLIVITIIGILTVLGARQFGNVTTKASVTTDFSNAQSIANAIRQAMYMDDKDEDENAIDYDAGIYTNSTTYTTVAISTISSKIEKYIGAIPSVEAVDGYNWYVCVNEANEAVIVCVGDGTTTVQLSPRLASYTGTYAAS